MRLLAKAKAMTAVLLLGCAVRLLRAQNEDPDYRHPGTSDIRSQSAAAIQKQREQEEPANDRTPSQDDRLSLMAAALRYPSTNARGGLGPERDCSHLVHAIYEQAGLGYSYAPSSEIYAGAEGFERVKKPQPGDLIVWRGHVGIVIQPSQHIFFSDMRSGPGTDDYESPYWKSRGRPRFYRYMKEDLCAKCDSAGARSHHLVKIKE